MDQLILNIIPTPECSFANFVAGKNDEVLSTLLDFDNDLCSSKILFLWGEEGSGKTHLISSLNSNILKVEDIDGFNEEEQYHLFNLINEVRASQKQLIISANKSPNEIIGIRDDLLSRLQWGLVLNLKPLSDQEKFNVIEDHAKQLGLHINDNVIKYCLNNLRRDLNTLINTLEALNEWSLKTKSSITINLIKKLQDQNII